MKTVGFMRHGEAEEYRPDDFGRQLTPRGRQVAALTASQFREHGFEPSLILLSSATRTVQTTEEVRKSVHPRNQVELISFYQGGFDEMLAALVEHGDGHDSVLLVGHNPAWSYTISELTGETLSLRPGQCALLTMDQEGPWETVFSSLGQWQLQHFFEGR